MQFQIGCDPEVFIKLGDSFISAHGILPGTKEEPYEVECGAVQVDGLAFEFNINPAKTPEEFNTNISVVLSQMDEMIKESVDKDASIEFTAFANFDKKYFETIPDEAKILGCDPDYNRTGRQNPRPNIMYQPFRTAAGHIHIGWTDLEDITPEHFQDCRYIADNFFKKQILSSNLKDDEAKRLSYYGSNGAFRPKKYGIEYRMPSNHWVANAESRLKTFSKVYTAMESLRK